MNRILGLSFLLILSTLGLNAGAKAPAGTSPVTASGDSFPDSVATALHFLIGQSAVDPEFSDNSATLDTIMQAIMQYSKLGRDFSVDIIGLASPDGTVQRNEQLASQRAENSRNYIRSRAANDMYIKFTVRNGGINWKGLKAVLTGAPEFNCKKEALAILDAILPDGSLPDAEIAALRRLDEGKVWSRLYADYFPDLRKALVTVFSPPRVGQPSGLITVYEVPEEPVNQKPVEETAPVPDADIVVAEEVMVGEVAPDVAEAEVEAAPRPFYMSLSTNMLYDALLLPNIGIEFYLGKNWSIDANWIYGWWDCNERHRYWRAYGGDIALRKWFGSAAARKPLTGHHLGVYAQMLLYDFEFGGKGQMAGEPGRNIWEKANYGAGIEYGYSLPIGRRLNIDFTIGIGYLGGEYYEYRPEDGHYVWLNTKKRRWVGPTKAQISLVWLLGRDNTNKKGGKL